MPPEVTDEHADKEHADPGTGNPPNPRTDERNDDDAADTGSRRDTPDVARESSVDSKLREILGLDPDADIIKAAEDLLAEVKPLREAAKSHSEQRSFAEMFPEQARELAEGRKERQETRAKEFSEQFRNITDKDGVPTGKGYPSVVIDKLSEVHKKFAEGNANINDFTDVLELVGKTGLVDFREAGSSTVRTYVGEDGDAAMGFAEAVAQVQEKDSLDYGSAVKVAAEKHPELFAAYRQQVTGRR